jgi:hypothetical protein
VTLVAFDLIELDGRDLRRERIEQRKAELVRILDGCRPSIVVNAVFNEPGAVVFNSACALGCEGILSKRWRVAVCGRADRALAQGQEPGGAEVRREAEEDCGPDDEWKQCDPASVAGFRRNKAQVSIASILPGLLLLLVLVTVSFSPPAATPSNSVSFRASTGRATMSSG